MPGSRALAGLRVLELGSLIGAPFCGTLMAEFGADVIKVEDPEVGDPERMRDDYAFFGRIIKAANIKVD